MLLFDGGMLFALLPPLFLLGKPSKNKFGESWDIIPTPPGPSPPYHGWDAYQKIKNI